MIKCKMETVEVEVPTSVICDVCGKEYDCKEDVMEVQEFYHIAFKGGYGSIFGDGLAVKLDICQGCLKAKLGEYLKIDKEEN